MNTIKHRRDTALNMEEGSVLISYSGIPVHSNEDDYYPFEVNSNFFWLTNSAYQRQALVLFRVNNMEEVHLFIQKVDPFTERWTGKMPTKEDMAKLTGIPAGCIHEVDEMKRIISSRIDLYQIHTAYFDTYRYDEEDLPDYNLVMAQKFHAAYPGIAIRNLREITGVLRRIKDADEIDCLRKAIAITDNGLKEMISVLKPGMKEYQAQTVFESSCRMQGAEKFSFPTIAASGLNATSMHYMTNRDEIHKGDLVLFDLGAKYGNYCSDISRTYPADGVYTKRQREIYAIVLKANRTVKQTARPGLTLVDLNRTAQNVLGEGLIQLGIIHDLSQLGNYYMHSVSHFIGIDCHDVTVKDMVLRPGAVISDEPGLYIDEEKIGIRIEDDLLITEDGCECLSEEIMRDPDEIEAYMASHHRDL